MNTNELDYHLPKHLIAQQPIADRSRSKLMVVDSSLPQFHFEHCHFADIIQKIDPGDCLVVNDTRVIPAKFTAYRDTSGKIEGLFLELTEDKQLWRVLLRNASRLRIDETITLKPQCSQAEEVITLTVVERQGQGHWLLRANSDRDYLDILESFGRTPLPPYIHRDGTDREHLDREQYQTVYADGPGSVAAPTAGLHFTCGLLDALKDKGVSVAKVTLHVGIGTFKPVTTERLLDHPMHAEQYRLDGSDAEVINSTIDNGRRVIAVGTTSVRTLETLADGRYVQAGSGWTKLFITPGYEFKIVNAIVTNFHLPRTTLLALVCAFAGTERMLAAYAEAVSQQYRFFSYGDAMLVFQG